MWNRILVIISEWWSEPSFIKELIKTNYWFKNSELTWKWQEIIEKENFYVFFSHPICINWNYWHKGWWDDSILDEKTYIKVKHMILQTFSHLLIESDITYFIQTDINNKEDKEKAIKYNIIRCPKWELYISFSSLMIESWFISWLWQKLLDKYNINKKSLNKFFKSNIDDYQNIKTELDNILPSYISWNRNEIWREFWKYIDIEQAKEKSKSFKNFMKIIDDLFNF